MPDTPADADARPHDDEGRARPDGGEDRVDAAADGEVRAGDAAADGEVRAGDAADDDGVSRRRIVRIVLVIAFAVPVVIEGLTFTRLLGGGLFGSGDDEDGTATGTADTGTPGTDPVGVGDELIPATPVTETLTDAVVRVGGAGREFRVDVTVENTTDRDYELRLGAVTTEDGTVVDGDVSRAVPPGDEAVVSAAWSLPSDATPATLSVTTVLDDEETSHTVALGPIPLRNGAA